jgi:hypothetical protein
MSLDDRNKLNRLEELKGKLFSKSYKTKIEHRDEYSHISRSNVVDSWGERQAPELNNEDNFFMKTSRFKKFFIFSIIFFCLTCVYAIYVFFAGGNTVSNDNIDISISGNNFTAGGEELSLVVGITNRNSSPLELADLIMEYPKGTGTDLSSDTQTFRQTIGTIPAGVVQNENLKLVLFGEQGSVRPIKFTLEYRVAGSNAIFVKEKDYQVSISSTPINLSVDGPTAISPNQSITLKVKETLNATTPSPNILMQVVYPPGFQFASAIPAPSFGNNVWSLGDLAPGAEHDISISGKMAGVFDGEQKTFNVSTGSQSSADKSAIGVVFNSIAQTITVQKPFVDASIFINGVQNNVFAIDSKTSASIEIHYVNNLDTQINNLQIKAKVSGNALDRKTINVQQGFYDSGTDTITWDKNYQNQFNTVNPGDSGSVSFSVSPLSLFSAASGILSNPSMNIEVDVSGSQSSSGSAVSQITNSNSAVINIISDVGFSSKALYYSGPFTDTGPIPPKVGKTTTYTVTWTFSNTANSISGVQVNSTLPAWVNFVGSISPASEDLTYNSSTSGIVWNVDRIQKGAGITGPARSVSFKVSFTPSLSQVGTIPTIINDAILTGHDDFANVDVKIDKASLNTKLDSDAQFPANGGVVVN